MREHKNKPTAWGKASLNKEAKKQLSIWKE